MSKDSGSDSSGPGKYANSETGASHVLGAHALDALDSVVLQDVISAVLHTGDAIQFGLTRDGGAVVITMYSEGALDKVYAATQEELQMKLEGIQVAAGV